jgi:hypothetical protein
MSGLEIVLLSNYSCERESLICCTIEDISIEFSIFITKIFSQGMDKNFGNLRKSFGMLHEITGIEKPWSNTTRFEDKT